MKQQPPPLTADQLEEIDESSDRGAAIAASLVEDLLDPFVQLPAPPVLPRSVSWTAGQNGLLIVTDQSSVLVPIARSDDFTSMMRAIIHPGFTAEIAGNC